MHRAAVERGDAPSLGASEAASENDGGNTHGATASTVQKGRLPDSNKARQPAATSHSECKKNVPYNTACGMGGSVAPPSHLVRVDDSCAVWMQSVAGFALVRTRWWQTLSNSVCPSKSVRCALLPQTIRAGPLVGALTIYFPKILCIYTYV